MKRGFAFLFLLLIGISFVSAVDVSCSSGGNLSSDFKEVDVGDKKTINGLGVGVTSADEVPVMNKIMAEVMIDAGKASVSNSSYLDYVDLSDGQHTVTFINVSGENAFIKIDGDLGNLVAGDTVSVGSFKVFLSEITGDSVNPGANLLFGKSGISLSNYENPTDKVSTSKGNYVIELFSASDESATLKVYACDNGEISIAGEETSSDDDSADSANEPEADDTPAIIDSKIAQLLQNKTETPVIIMIKDKGNESLNEKAVLDIITELGTNIVLTDEGERYFSGNITQEGFDLIKNNLNILSIQSSVHDDAGSEIEIENETLDENAGIFKRFWRWFKGIFS